MQSPGSLGGQPSDASCLTLLRVRFTDQYVTVSARGLLPHAFDLTLRPLEAERGILSVALSLRSPSLDVIQHPALRSPDFPPSCLAQRPSVALNLLSIGGGTWRIRRQSSEKRYLRVFVLIYLGWFHPVEDTAAMTTRL